ncbi:hypothetical protein K458DRAFT_122024 [Lentithecium fluviatile CBS 122367]|uniref:Uncharacterized protein n=1 Tax=Lentithecium fluviatile CBS 122367 TaxID=1168545 RepID=A0A6G1ILY5_9PLEO|nr:hypothetical protein K458DRAFT_122024 [Lentithecium fluviatile CBS 122367]
MHLRRRSPINTTISPLCTSAGPYVRSQHVTNLHSHHDPSCLRRIRCLITRTPRREDKSPTKSGTKILRLSM